MFGGSIIMQLKASRFLSSEPITSNEAQTILSSKFNSILTDFKFLSSDKSNNKLNSGVHIFRMIYLNKVCSSCHCHLQDDWNGLSHCVCRFVHKQESASTPLRSRSHRAKTIVKAFVAGFEYFSLLYQIQWRWR